MSEMYDRLVTILVTRFEVEPEEVRPDATFEELELDSLFLVELGLVIQQELGVKISEEDATPRSTIASVVELIEAQLARVTTAPSGREQRGEAGT
jgi:acyl carrier protein